MNRENRMTSLPAPSDGRASYYFDSYHERWSLRHLFHKRRIDSLVQLVPAPARVLDAGCGSGVLCRVLADQGCTVAGVDLEPARAAWCQRLVPEGQFSAGDVRSFRLPATYGVVICSEVLEHFGAADRQTAFQNLASHLESGGTLIVTVPSATYIRLEPAWELIRAWQYGPENHDDEACHEIVSPAELEAGMSAAGCDVKRSGSACWGLVRWWVARKR